MGITILVPQENKARIERSAATPPTMSALFITQWSDQSADATTDSESGKLANGIK